MTRSIFLLLLLTVSAHAGPKGAAQLDAVDAADQQLGVLEQQIKQPNTPPEVKQELRQQAARQMDKLDMIGAQRPLDPAAQQKITVVFMRHAAPARALTSADRLVNLEPQDANARVLHGNVYYAMQDYERANADAKRALELDPTNKQAQILFSMTRGRVNRPGGMVAGAGGSPSAGQGQTVPAAAPAAFMAAPSPAVPSAAQLQAQTQAAATADRLRSDGLVRDALSREALGDHEAAKAGLDKAVAADAKNPLALAARASVRARAGDGGGALADANAALALDARSAQAMLARAQAKELLGSPAPEILADYKAAAELDPQLAPELTAALARAGTRGGAVAAAAGSVKPDPLDPANATDRLFGRLPEPVRKHWPLGVMGLTLIFVGGSILWLRRRG